MSALREQPARLPPFGRPSRARLAADPLPLAVRALLALMFTSALAQGAQRLEPTCTYAASTPSPPLESPTAAPSPGPAGWDHLDHLAARHDPLQPHGGVGARRAQLLYLRKPPRSVTFEVQRDVALTALLLAMAGVAALAPAWPALRLPPPRRCSRRQHSLRSLLAWLVWRARLFRSAIWRWASALTRLPKRPAGPASAMEPAT